MRRSTPRSHTGSKRCSLHQARLQRFILLWLLNRPSSSEFRADYFRLLPIGTMSCSRLGAAASSHGGSFKILDLSRHPPSFHLGSAESLRSACSGSGEISTRLCSLIPAWAEPDCHLAWATRGGGFTRQLSAILVFWAPAPYSACMPRRFQALRLGACCRNKRAVTPMTLLLAITAAGAWPSPIETSTDFALVLAYRCCCCP